MIEFPNNKSNEIYNKFKNQHKEKLQNLFNIKKIAFDKNELENIYKGFTSFIFTKFEKYRNQELLQSTEYIEKLLKESINNNFTFSPYITDFSNNPDFWINPYIQKEIGDQSLLYIGIFPYKENKFGINGKIYWGIFGYENWYINAHKYIGHILAKYFILLSLGLRNYFVNLGWFDKSKYIPENQILTLQKNIYTPTLQDLINRFNKNNIDPNILYEIQKQILNNLKI